MNIILKKILLVCFLSLAMLSIALGQVKFSAVISPEQINKDEYATLRIIIENADDVRKLSPPSFKDFMLVSGPNQETGMSNVNGVINQYIAISYVLQPRQAGKIVLGSASADINGKKYYSQPIKLYVKNAKGGGNTNNAANNPFAAFDPFSTPPPREDFKDFTLKKGENIADKVSKNMQLKLEVSKTSCFVGEPIVASYKLYTRLKSESKLTQNPSFNGFSVIDLQQSDIMNYGREKLNGREYNVYTIRKAQLYPLQDGTIELESATLENNIQFLKEDGQALQNNIDGYINGYSINPDAIISETISLSSKPVSITVKPLPEIGKPASFKGAVGKFSITASLDKNNFTTDETGKLLLEISGAGNLQLLTQPDIKWPQQMEVFDSKVNEDLNQTDVPVTGSKRFEILFAIQNAGSYEIPAIEFSYFDPATASYKTFLTKPISFSVQKGKNKPAQVANIATIKKPTSFLYKLFANRALVVALIALMMITGLFLWLRHDRKKEKQQSGNENITLKKGIPAIENLNETFPETVQNPLSLSENCMNSIDCNNFYSLLNQELKTFLAKEFSLQTYEINSKKIAFVMDRAGIDNGVALQVQQLMQDIEWQLYTPLERNEAMPEFYNRAQLILQTLHAFHHVNR